MGGNRYEDVEWVGAAKGTETGEPRPEWIRGVCPDCGGPLVYNVYYVGGNGYVLIWECWHSLGLKSTCTYQKVIA